MMYTKMQVISRNQDTEERETRTYSSCNPNYIGLIGSGSAPALPYGVENYWYWADTVARGMLSLSQNSYYDVNMIATASMTEELAG